MKNGTGAVGGSGRVSDRGAAIIEYALLVALVAMIAIGGVRMIGGSLNETFTSPELVTSCGGYQTAWDAHLDLRSELLATNSWRGSANRDARLDWAATRDTLNEVRDTYC